MEVVQVQGLGSPGVSVPIPGGEAWLLHSINFDYLTSAVVGNRTFRAQLFQDSEDIATCPQFGTVGANTSLALSWNIGGIGTAASTPLDNIFLAASLPWLIATMGMEWLIGGTGNFAGDSITELVSMVVTKFEYGGASSGIPEVTGPYMYVPGPTATAA
jgi:hypothetical protein